MITKYSKRRACQAFSLVEVVIALGIITFACVSLLALMANGLTTVNHAISNTVEAEIAQSMINLSQVNTYNPTLTTNFYFDSEGSVLASTNQNIVYTATVVPGALMVPALTPYTLNNGSGVTLQVTVTNRNNPLAISVFSMVWANSGN